MGDSLMVSAGQIRNVVSQFLSHGDAEKFVSEFDALSCGVHKDGNRDALDLANRIESLLADLHVGMISKSIFRDCLRSLCVSYVSDTYHFMAMSFPNSVNSMVEGAVFPESPALVGTSTVVEFGSPRLLPQ
jgi:hypothetical protein